MGFFDGTGEALYDAGTGLQRTQAALEGTLGQFDTQQQNIATSKQKNFKDMMDELENIALSGDNRPEAIRPKLEAVAKAAKARGVNFPTELIDHLSNNPIILGASYDEDVLKHMNPQDQNNLRRYTALAFKGGVEGTRAIAQRDDLLTQAMLKGFEENFAGVKQELLAQGKKEGPELNKEAMQLTHERFSPRYRGASTKATKDFFTIMADAKKLEEDKTANEPKNMDDWQIRIQHKKLNGGDVTADQAAFDAAQQNLTKPSQIGNEIAQGYFNSPFNKLGPEAKKSFNMIRSMPKDAANFLGYVTGGETDFSNMTSQEVAKHVKAATDKWIEVTRVQPPIAAAGPIAAARTEETLKAKQEFEQNAPLDLRAVRWVHPDTLRQASPDMTPKEAKAAGMAVLTPQLSQAVPSARTALEALKKYRELTLELLPSIKGKSTLEALAIVQANKAALKVRELAGDPTVKDFIALGSTVPTQVKAFGDTGNIAFKESEFALLALPGFGDSQESGLKKVDSREKLLKSVVRNALSSASQSSTGGKLGSFDDYLKDVAK